MSHPVLDGIGWLGAALVIVAYALVSFNRLTPGSFFYQGLNVVGSALLIVNVVWAAIGLVAVTRKAWS
jgi:hypothetical protein